MARNLLPAFDIIEKFEGLYLKAYLDPVKIPTIGYGSIRYPNGVAVKMGDEITLAQANQYLAHEIEKTAKQVETLIKVPCNDNQFCALVSFAFNVGTDIDADDKAEGLGDSTLLKLLNKGDYQGAADELPKWNKAGGKVLAGLTRRRVDERALFMTPAQGTLPTTRPPEPQLEAELAEIEMDKVPSWFLPFKKIIDVIVKFITGEKGPDSGLIPDNADTGAPAKSETLVMSDGSGPRISRQRVKEILEANGVDTTQFCTLHIRGYFLDTYGAKGKNDRGVFDDAIVQYSPDFYYTYRANVDPSKVRKGVGFGNKKGMAVLKTGVWPGYYPGMHNGSVPHLAFRQGARVTVRRDGFDADYDETGMFGINLHKGGVNTTSSAGCQTVQAGDWAKFKADGDAQLKKYKQKTFTITLVDELDLRQNKLKVG